MCKAVWLSAVSYTSEGPPFILFIVTEEQRHNSGSSSSLPRTPERRDFCPFLRLRRAEASVCDVPVFQAPYALFASAAKCQSQSWGALFVGPFTFWLAIIVLLYLMLWIALQLNNGLWAVCSAPQRSSCLSTALTDDLSDSDIKTVQSCFPRSFNSSFVCLLLTTQWTWEFLFGSRLCGC